VVDAGPYWDRLGLGKKAGARAAEGGR